MTHRRLLPLRRRLPVEPRPGRRQQVRQRRAHALLGEQKQGEPWFLRLFVCLAALAAMNAMLMGRIGLGILTGLGVGMVAFCVAILIEASVEIHVLGHLQAPRSAAMLRALPLLVLAVYISYHLIVWIFPNLGTEYIPAHSDSPAVEAAPGEFPMWASDLISVQTLLRHRQGDPARRLRVDSKGRAQALTSQLLDETLRIPHARIVHNLRPDPGFEPFVDHAVLYRRLLLVLEFHSLPGGSWSHSADGLRAHGTAGASIGLSAARAALHKQCRLRRLRVRVLVVVHSADGRPIQLRAEEPSKGLQVQTAAEFAETVGQLCVEQDGRPAGRRPFSELVHLMD